MRNERIGIGALTVGLGVALGAFGAHFLRARLGEAGRPVFETGVIYQLIHGLAILVCGLLPREKEIERASWCFAAGTLLFSGSLYALSLTYHKNFGAITPLGGLLFLIGWALLANWGLRQTSQESAQL